MTESSTELTRRLLEDLVAAFGDAERVLSLLASDA
jgi:uncharacterized protein (TIGR02246 family)